MLKRRNPGDGEQVLHVRPRRRRTARPLLAEDHQHADISNMTTAVTASEATCGCASVCSLRNQHDDQRDERRQEDEDAEKAAGFGICQSWRGFSVQDSVQTRRVVRESRLSAANVMAPEKADQQKQRHRADDDEHHVLPQPAGLHAAQRQAEPSRSSRRRRSPGRRRCSGRSSRRTAANRARASAPGCR